MAIVLLLAFTCTVFADRNVPAEPEIQGLATSTGMNVQGTVTETDSAAWSVNANGIPISGDDPVLASYPNWANFPGGLPTFLSAWHSQQTLNPNIHLQDFLTILADQNFAQDLQTWLQNQGSPLTPPLNDQEVQYTTGYNDQTMAVSGQSSFVKSMAISTANKIADQSNIKADTSFQFIAIDTGRATRTEDILLDGAAQGTNTSSAILCPFATSVSPVIPAYCNIEQAGSSIDTTLTSVITHADDRFVGTDSTFPVVLNYQINAQGISLSDGTSSPMIGSASAFLKIHKQEARNESVTAGVIRGPATITASPLKSLDLVYSESSSASGLITKFSKSMSYQSGFNLI